MDEPEAMHRDVSQFRALGFRAFKIGWGPFGRRSDAGLDEAIVVAARDAVGVESALMVDAGGSDAFWPNKLKWAMATAQMLAATTSPGSRNRSNATRSTTMSGCARQARSRSPAAKC